MLMACDLKQTIDNVAPQKLRTDVYKELHCPCYLGDLLL